MIDRALSIRIRTLAEEYVADVRRLKAAGDHHAEYHAQRPKVKAYGALMHAGMTPRQAVDYFKQIEADVFQHPDPERSQ
jgi:hypothetical protein